MQFYMVAKEAFDGAFQTLQELPFNRVSRTIQMLQAGVTIMSEEEMTAVSTLRDAAAAKNGGT